MRQTCSAAGTVIHISQENKTTNQDTKWEKSSEFFYFSPFNPTRYQNMVIFREDMNFFIAFFHYLYYNHICKKNLPFEKFFLQLITPY